MGHRGYNYTAQVFVQNKKTGISAESSGFFV